MPRKTTTKTSHEHAPAKRRGRPPKDKETLATNGAPVLITAKRVRALCQKHGVSISNEALEALNSSLLRTVALAGRRAKANQQKTIRDYDV